MRIEPAPPPPSLKKVTSFPSNPALKVEALSSPPFLNLIGGSTLSPFRNGGGAYYITLTETDKLRIQSSIRLLFTAHPELLNSRVALYFPFDLNHPLKFIYWSLFWSEFFRSPWELLPWTTSQIFKFTNFTKTQKSRYLQNKTFLFFQIKRANLWQK